MSTTLFFIIRNLILLFFKTIIYNFSINWCKKNYQLLKFVLLLKNFYHLKLFDLNFVLICLFLYNKNKLQNNFFSILNSYLYFIVIFFYRFLIYIKTKIHQKIYHILFVYLNNIFYIRFLFLLFMVLFFFLLNDLFFFILFLLRLLHLFLQLNK